MELQFNALLVSSQFKDFIFHPQKDSFEHIDHCDIIKNVGLQLQ